MAFKALQEQEKTFFTIVLLLGYLSCKVICETGDCRQQEFKDGAGNCILCKPCGPGMELSKECGFGYGEDAQCVTCRPHRFKEDWGFQKCKACLDCALLNRFQKANCSVTSDAVCGDCLPGFYRKTKLVGFQDMECVPCGDPPPPYEPHCTSKVNLVKIASTASSPRDTALAAVICSALATVLLALLILCVIYCKRQFMEKKPSWSLRSQDIQYNGSELSCFDRPHLSEYAHRACCQCYQDLAQAYGPVHLIPSLCCEGTCGTDRTVLGCGVHSVATLQERNAAPVGETMPMFFASLSRSVCGKFSDACPLMQNPTGGDDISFCDSYPELTGEEVHSLDPENESSTSLDSNSSQDLVCGAVSVQALSADFTDTADLLRHSSTVTEPTLVQDALPTRSQLDPEGSEPVGLAISLQEA
ncbi:tumor necrosis factor receptor superfamily member 19 [Heterocephalus glaber]|uniref:Tumor necrosis factor receptor superfamily member 19 n=1 Tax=Heterocephalus glaber TaxID=10181 RepID=A0AAX6R7X4_HETGA|nr:tumor necrosis factor receptor superfamily member 19 [Heterocephalus glaber]XP_021092015.1 tumor necrosis factor receptor superfamily member 19 [Heterocephalus glaber]XP_021092016.1 tumor necrosis factor receptor superfamily member 19 [Heterocephalus glaber]XP_021092017.1 tumor necrosis factor receptor superfamily member 19 [Heterocephalus glaber]XP_021092018.1 tumor necrosis factor receptor superfamily member 19 [Heterocephalus glaber]